MCGLKHKCSGFEQQSDGLDYKCYSLEHRHGTLEHNTAALEPKCIDFERNFTVLLNTNSNDFDHKIGTC
jgi:hypothetical protein